MAGRGLKEKNKSKGPEGAPDSFDRKYGFIRDLGIVDRREYERVKSYYYLSRLHNCSNILSQLGKCLSTKFFRSFLGTSFKTR